MKKHGTARKPRNGNGVVFQEDKQPEEQEIARTFDEDDEYMHEDDDDDAHSFKATPKMGGPSAVFEDVALDTYASGGNNDKHHGHMKRLRMGTQRNKKGKAQCWESQDLKMGKEEFPQSF